MTTTVTTSVELTFDGDAARPPGRDVVRSWLASLLQMVERDQRETGNLPWLTVDHEPSDAIVNSATALLADLWRPVVERGVQGGEDMARQVGDECMALFAIFSTPDESQIAELVAELGADLIADAENVLSEHQRREPPS